MTTEAQIRERDTSLDIIMGWCKLFPGTAENIGPAAMRVLADSIDIALSEVKVKEGHVRLPDGREPMVLGTLPMTADGCVAGSGARVWGGREDLPPIAREVAVVTDCERGRWPVEWCYSTREAALNPPTGGSPA